MNEGGPLLVLGTGPMALELADVAEDCGFEVAGFVENLDRAMCAEPVGGLPVHWIDDAAHLATTHLAIIGIGTTRRGRFVDDANRIGLRFATVVHPTARVSKRAAVATGCIVNALAAVAAYAELGEHVFVNRGATVGHHTVLGPQSSVMPGANVAGCCTIGARTWISTGATVIDKLTIGADTMVAAGAVVTRELPANVLAAGVPAEVIRENYTAR